MKVYRWFLGTLLLAGILLQPAVGSAVVLGQIDTFQVPVQVPPLDPLQNWDAGLGGIEPPFPPVVIPDGGPGGIGDHYMQITGIGGLPNPGSRISVANRDLQWAGNYLAAGVNVITLSLKNTGATDLVVRLSIGDVQAGTLPPLNIAVTKDSVVLPVGGDWVTATFHLTPSRMAAARGNVLTALTNAGELRIMHNPNPTFPPPTAAGKLGVDNVKASAAVTVGWIDTFQYGTLQNWDAGLGGTEPPFPPEIIPGGGPGGAGDAFMQVTAIGGTVNPGSRLSVVNRNAQWSGNYLAAGVNFITMWLRNTGPNNLQVRLVIADVAAGTLPPNNIAVSTQALPLPVGGDWVKAAFPVGPGFLTAARGTVHAALTNAGELRVIHNPAATFPPPIILGRLAVDNVQAERRAGQPYLPLLLLDD
jgi:hypothetical protein